MSFLESAHGTLLEDQFARARTLYYQGIYGDRLALSQATELLANLHQQRPENSLVTVYYGSTRLVEAGHTWALWKKNSLSKEGIQLMDNAVAADPQSLETRFVRGATERELPAFFGRKEQAREDIRTIVTQVQSSSGKPLEPRLLAASFYYYGLDCLETGGNEQGVEALHAAVQAAPDSHAGKLAAEKLKALP